MEDGRPIPKDRIEGKRIASISPSRDGDSLRLGVRFEEVGALMIQLDRPGDWGWPIALDRSPPEVCMLVIGPDKSHHYVCGGQVTDEQLLSGKWEGQRIVDILEDPFRLVLDDGAWTPEIHYTTGQSVIDRVRTRIRLTYEE